MNLEEKNLSYDSVKKIDCHLTASIHMPFKIERISSPSHMISMKVIIHC